MKPTAARKKTLFLNQGNIRRAMRLFEAKTETEAVNRALELAAEEAEIIAAHHEARSKAPRLVQVYR